MNRLAAIGMPWRRGFITLGVLLAAACLHDLVVGVGGVWANALGLLVGVSCAWTRVRESLDDAGGDA